MVNRVLPSLPENARTKPKKPLFVIHAFGAPTSTSSQPSLFTSPMPQTDVPNSSPVRLPLKVRRTLPSLPENTMA